MEYGHSIQKEGDRIMKVRTDFVTNSSSNSFILARKGELTEKQKDAIIQFVENEILGKKMLTPDNSEKEIQEIFEEENIYEETQAKIRAVYADRHHQRGKGYGGGPFYEFLPGASRCRDHGALQAWKKRIMYKSRCRMLPERPARGTAQYEAAGF